jgi:hypothetical protein
MSIFDIVSQLQRQLANPHVFQIFIANPVAFAAQQGLHLDAALGSLLQKVAMGLPSLEDLHRVVDTVADSGIRPGAGGGGGLDGFFG